MFGYYERAWTFCSESTHRIRVDVKYNIHFILQWLLILLFIFSYINMRNEKKLTSTCYANTNTMLAQDFFHHSYTREKKKGCKERVL